MALDAAEKVIAPGESPPVSFATNPTRYRHWRLSIEGRVATLAMDVDENGGLRGGYAMKLNSYDLGVDIELHDAVQRLRFEHPEVAAVQERHPDRGIDLRRLHAGGHTHPCIHGDAL